MIGFLLLFLGGILGGIISGLLGVGGGIVFIFILPYAFTPYLIPEAYEARFIIANSVLCILLSSVAANITHILKKKFYPAESLIIGLSATVFSLFSLNFLVMTRFFDLVVFNLLVVVMLLVILIVTLVQSGRDFPERPFQKKDSAILTIAGAAGGGISALTGLGGGAVIVPLLNSLLRMDIKKAKSISLGMIFFISTAMTIQNLIMTPPVNLGQYQLGYIDFASVLPVLMGVMIGSPLGVRLSLKITSATLAILFVVFIAVVLTEKMVQLIKLW